MDATATASGGDLALAAEVFRRYDADDSGALDRDELLAALRDLGLLGGRVSAAAAGRVLAEMDANGDGRVTFQEFRDTFSRMTKLRASEARAARICGAAPPVPPNAGVCPRLKAAFAAAAAYGCAHGLAGKGEGRKDEGSLTSRQFQRACAVAQVPVERATLDVIFAVAASRSRSPRLSFPRFLEALAQVSAEAVMPLDAVLDAVRATAPATAASPARDVDSRLPLSARARSRPRSAASPGSKQTAAPEAWPLPKQAAEPEAAAGVEGGRPPSAPAAAAFGAKLEGAFASLQALLAAVPSEEESILAHRPPEAAGEQQAQQAQAPAAGEALQCVENPTFHRPGPEAAGALRLEMLSLLDQRCEATEARCTALVATRGALASSLAAELQLAVAGEQEEARAQVAAALAGFEARAAALDERLSDGLRQLSQEWRGGVAALEARMEAALEAQRKAGEEASARVNAAVLAIAKRVGALTAGRAGEGH